MNEEVRDEQVVYGTTTYQVRVTTITEAESGNLLEVYGIFNRNTGVREAELRGYPHAVKWADNLEEQITAMIAERVAADVEEASITAALGPDEGSVTAPTEEVEPPTTVEEHLAKPAPEEVALSREDANAGLEDLIPAPDLA